MGPEAPRRLCRRGNDLGISPARRRSVADVAGRSPHLMPRRHRGAAGPRSRAGVGVPEAVFEALCADPNPSLALCLGGGGTEQARRGACNPLALWIDLSIRSVA